MPWASAKVHGVVVAETEFPQVVSGDVYFPPECVKWEYLSTTSPPIYRKGKAINYTLSVNGTVIPDAAWSHPDPANKKLMGVKNFVAFHGMAPVMLMYKKNFRYARVEDTRSDTSSIRSSTPCNSMPTTPTLGYATPAPPAAAVPAITFTYTYNPSMYDYRSQLQGCPQPSPPRLGLHCSATTLWSKKLPNIPEVEVCGLDVGED